jgi:hypothetical protein
MMNHTMVMDRVQTTPGLSDDQIRRYAPSVFATSPWTGASDRYKFVPTSEILAFFRDSGFFPVRAQQSRSRIPGKGDFTRHLLRFRSREHFGSLVVGQEIPELVFVNSHDRTSGVQLDSGVFRLVCTNGMIVKSADYGSVSVRHLGGADYHKSLGDAIGELVQRQPRVMATVGAWKQLALPRQAQVALAEAALIVKNGVPDDESAEAPARPDRSQPITAAQLLAPKRTDDLAAPDGSRSLWTTFNVVQEHILKGGDRGRSTTGRRTRTREVKSVGEDIRLNRALWALGERMAELMG